MSNGGRPVHVIGRQRWRRIGSRGAVRLVQFVASGRASSSSSGVARLEGDLRDKTLPAAAVAAYCLRYYLSTTPGPNLKFTLSAPSLGGRAGAPVGRRRRGWLSSKFYSQRKWAARSHNGAGATTSAAARRADANYVEWKMELDDRAWRPRPSQSTGSSGDGAGAHQLIRAAFASLARDQSKFEQLWVSGAPGT